MFLPAICGRCQIGKDRLSGLFFENAVDIVKVAGEFLFDIIARKLVLCARDVQPELYEVKYIYQNFWFTASNTGKCTCVQ